jgi:hypothetical protein
VSKMRSAKLFSIFQWSVSLKPPEPSLRPEWRADYFAANIGDPDGYNIEIAYKPWLYK